MAHRGIIVKKDDRGIAQIKATKCAGSDCQVGQVYSTGKDCPCKVNQSCEFTLNGKTASVVPGTCS